MIRILIADDSPDDAEQCIQALRQAKEPVRTGRVMDSAELRAALSGAEWDALLIEQRMANLSVPKALATLRDHGLDIPVIVVTRKIADPELQQAMVDGARDVVIKGRWARLLPALRRELLASADRRSSARVSEEMRRLEDRYRVMIEGSREAVCYCHDGMYVDANPAYLALVGYHDIGELKGVPILNLVANKDRARLKSQLRSPDGFRDSREYTAITSGGEQLPVEIAVSAVNIEGEPCVQVVVTDISKRKALETRLQFLHQRDVLTGLCNRPYFLQELGKAIDLVRADYGSCFLISLELHQIREINEALGHEACDRLLLMLTRQLLERVTGQQLIGRVGGGQFAILQCATARESAEQLMQALRQMTAAFRFSEGAERFDFRFGLNLVEIDRSIEDRQRLLAEAFHRDVPAEPVRIPEAPQHTPAPVVAEAATAQIVQLVTLNPTLQEAMSKERYQMLFQPLINLRGEPRQYYEAFVFLETGDGALVPAAQFMPAAEKAGLAAKVDRWVVQRAITALSKCARQQAHAELFIPLSQSAATDPMLLPAIAQHLKAMRLSPARLHFQVAGLAVKQQGAAMLHFLHQARKAGIGVVLDDYNPRLFTAQELAGIPADFIKINCALPECAEEAALRHAADNARSCSKQSVATRVEDMAVFTLLWNCGLDYVQGESLSPPGNDMDYSFESEQTLTSDRPPANPWQLSAG
ncbi:MAG: EAL domain-containing protein [Acidiferrobacterales bacterium]